MAIRCCSGLSVYVGLDIGVLLTYRHFGIRRNVAMLDKDPELQNFLKAVASETRQRILFCFNDGQPRTVGQIAEQLNIVPSTASEHLAILKRGGLVAAKREGKEVYYWGNRAKTLELLKKLTKQLTYVLTICCPEKKKKS
jgi:DNA-binding transcriptional ArsR family regulator